MLHFATRCFSVQFPFDGEFTTASVGRGLAPAAMKMRVNRARREQAHALPYSIEHPYKSEHIDSINAQVIFLQGLGNGNGKQRRADDGHSSVECSCRQF